MPTLREFINTVLAENNMTSNTDEIIKMITKIAKERATDGCAAISDDEVREMVINNADLAERLAEARRLKEEEQKAKAEALAAEKNRKAEEEKLAKQLEEERKTAVGEQLNLFG